METHPSPASARTAHLDLLQTASAWYAGFAAVLLDYFVL